MDQNRPKFMNLGAVDILRDRIGYDSIQLDTLKEYIEMRQFYNGGIKEIVTKIEVLDEEFSVKYERNPIHHILYRLKTPISAIDKLKRLGVEPSVENMRKHLTDIAGVRVICNYIKDIYNIAHLLKSQDDITLIKETDYIKTPKPNGYRSLHIVLGVPVFLSDHVEPVPVEIQIRTIAMDFWASLEHQLRYKSSVNVPEELRERLRQCAEKSAELDTEMQAILTALEEQALDQDT